MIHFLFWSFLVVDLLVFVCTILLNVISNHIICLFSCSQVDLLPVLFFLFLSWFVWYFHHERSSWSPLFLRAFWFVCLKPYLIEKLSNSLLCVDFWMCLITVGRWFDEMCLWLGFYCYLFILVYVSLSHSTICIWHCQLERALVVCLSIPM